VNRSADPFDELGLLTAALCDGEITPDQATRLEQLANQSSRSREFFLRYVQLHGELYWETAVSAGRDRPPELEPFLAATSCGAELAEAAKPAGATSKPMRLRFAWITAVATVILAALLGVASYRHWLWKPQPLSEPALVARVARTFETKWSDGEAKLEGTDLLAGRQLNLREGLAEIRFQSGALAILEGPAAFELASRDEGFLQAGRLTASVPGGAPGFRVRTPSATIVDRGTEFGVVVEEGGGIEVHVFAGAVEVQPKAGPGGESAQHQVHAGQAVRVLAAGAGTVPKIDRIAFDSSDFIRSLPVPGSVAGFRALVARHPNLIHHYTFEGVTRQEKCRDKKGNLDLIEVVMHGGDGGGSLDYALSGLDATTNAVRPYRAPHRGNATGVALQSNEAFQPPQALTVEVLLRFDGSLGVAEGEISTAIATRAGARDCGLFIIAADQGRLVHLMDGDAPWVDSGVEFIPGEWYYVASTFRVEQRKTIVNTYVANVTRGKHQLQQVVEDEVAAGVPASSRLGVGKGFASDIAHAYPWFGGLDELAIYDAVLDRETLERHLRTLVVSQD